MTGCRIELGDVTPHNIKQLKKLNTVVFPVSYNDKFYKDVLEAGELAKLVMAISVPPRNNVHIIVDAVRRELAECARSGVNLSLLLVPAHVGTRGNERVDQAAGIIRYSEAYYNDIVVGAVCCRIDTSENSRRLYIMTLGCLFHYRRLGIGTKMLDHVLNFVEKDGHFDSIFLHVQVNNEDAIKFYKKFGFEIVETKEHYYKRIEPADAHVLQKTLRPCAPMVNGTAKITNGDH